MERMKYWQHMFPPTLKKKKTIIKWSIVVRRAVLVDSNLSVEKCQTAIKELYLFYGIEHFWNKFGEIISFKELENIRKISNSLSQFSVIERLKTIFSISIRIGECSRKMNWKSVNLRERKLAIPVPSSSSKLTRYPESKPLEKKEKSHRRAKYENDGQHIGAVVTNGGFRPRSPTSCFKT